MINYIKYVNSDIINSVISCNNQGATGCFKTSWWY